MTHRQFIEAGLRIFPLWGFTGTGDDAACECGNPRCQAAGKHPRASNWQHTPEWDEDQLDAMETYGQLASGYGVLCAGLLVVDVDARNGGLASYAALCEAVPDVQQAGLIVATGSGGGSKHLYFRVPLGQAYLAHLPQFPGLDFKTSGFVVGPGSRHASGGQYSIAYGSPDDIEDAPPALLAMLAKPERHRAEWNGRAVDVAHSDLAEMLAHIPNNDLDYETWIRVGMAIHHATGGTGLELWAKWSATSAKNDAEATARKWHSFGRSANPVTLGTLIYHAEQGGWVMPVSLAAENPPADPAEAVSASPSIDLAGVDLNRPPGFVGRLAAWVDAQTRRPRRRLAVAAALMGVGNTIGLRYTDDIDGVTANLFGFCVAGSRTGKEAVLQSLSAIHRASGIAAASHGAIKSEQEVVRNLIRHQAALYAIDEIGIFLQKVKNAQKKGGAVYLDGVIGMLMSAYSKADGYMLLTGDARADLEQMLIKEAAQLQKQIDASEGGPFAAKKLEAVQAQLASLDSGLDRPFLSLMGFTTPETFNDLVDKQAATNGFIGRALIFNERETVPTRKRGWRRQAMPDAIAATLAQLYSAGEYDRMGGWRVEHYGPRVAIPTDGEAAAMLEQAADLLEEEARAHKSRTGLEALYLGAYELVAKVSLILAAPEGLRTTEHVRWAYALVRRDCEEKARLAFANDRERDSPKDSLKARIMSLIDGEEGETKGVIVNRLRQFKRADVETALAEMVSAGQAREERQSGSGRPTVRYFAA